MSRFLSHRFLNLFSSRLFILRGKDSIEYVIGVDLADLLQRSTSNLYKSLRTFHIPYRSASALEIDYLIENKRLSRHTIYSAKLVNLEDSMNLLLGRKQEEDEENPFKVLLLAAAKEAEEESSSLIFYAYNPDVPTEEDSSLEITPVYLPISPDDG